VDVRNIAPKSGLSRTAAPKRSAFFNNLAPLSR
jgi:hypothetical protein